MPVSELFPRLLIARTDANAIETAKSIPIMLLLNSGVEARVCVTVTLFVTVEVVVTGGRVIVWVTVDVLVIVLVVGTVTVDVLVDTEVKVDVFVIVLVTVEVTVFVDEVEVEVLDACSSAIPDSAKMVAPLQESITGKLLGDDTPEVAYSENAPIGRGDPTPDTE